MGQAGEIGAGKLGIVYPEFQADANGNITFSNRCEEIESGSLPST